MFDFAPKELPQFTLEQNTMHRPALNPIFSNSIEAEMAKVEVLKNQLLHVGMDNIRLKLENQNLRAIIEKFKGNPAPFEGTSHEIQQLLVSAVSQLDKMKAEVLERDQKLIELYNLAVQYSAQDKNDPLFQKVSALRDSKAAQMSAHALQGKAQEEKKEVYGKAEEKRNGEERARGAPKGLYKDQKALSPMRRGRSISRSRSRSRSRPRSYSRSPPPRHRSFSRETSFPSPHSRSNSPASSLIFTEREIDYQMDKYIKYGTSEMYCSLCTISMARNGNEKQAAIEHVNSNKHRNKILLLKKKKSLTKNCKFDLQGYCHNGAKCTFRHASGNFLGSPRPYRSPSLDRDRRSSSRYDRSPKNYRSHLKRNFSEI
eukprot:TRINITY_DN11242_c0_g1_i1.p1 TRINITY_DN11242_c0_g1~~TRINITY_DN11242_c0_g1_i1.p1  ORF type:complete len:372 (+),score=52.57 TRINITY_DN11242_c0_g1_i1:58-1173(+)